MLVYSLPYMFYPSLYFKYLVSIISYLGPSQRVEKDTSNKHDNINHIKDRVKEVNQGVKKVSFSEIAKTDSKGIEEKSKIINPMTEMKDAQLTNIGILFLLSIVIGMFLEFIASMYCPIEGVIDVIIINALVLVLVYDEDD